MIAVRRRPLLSVGCALLLAYVATAVVGKLTGDPTALVTDHAAAPSFTHPFGTDTLGRDLLARVGSAASLSLVISVASVGLALVVAVPLGLVAGSRHGRVIDTVVSRSAEIVQALPSFVLVVFLLGLVQGRDLRVGPVAVTTTMRVVLAIALAFVPYFTRVVRAATISEMQQDYVEGLVGVGVSRREILGTEVLVNVLPVVGAQAMLALAIAIFAEGGLSFLGLGVAPPHATLGNLIADAGPQLLDGPWWYALVPGIVMICGILGCNLVGDTALDAALTGHETAERRA